MVTTKNLLTAYEWLGLSIYQFEGVLTADERDEIKKWISKVYTRLKIDLIVPQDEWPNSTDEQWKSLQ